MKKKPILILPVALVFALWFFFRFYSSAPNIKIGLLHSLTGTMAISERSLLDAEMLAIDEINAAGGLLGMKVEVVVADSKSDPDHAAREAQRLLEVEQVQVIFGCWTTSCRKAVKPVVEKNNSLLFYPLQYEGFEQSEHIIYTGSAPNQQIIPGVRWALNNIGKRALLVGSDYYFPRAANLIIKDLVRAQNGIVVDEIYVPLGSTDMSPLIRRIKQGNVQIIFNTVNGDSNTALFESLYKAGITSAQLPVMSFSVTETEFSRMDIKTVTGNYAVWNYFQSHGSPENRAFIDAFQKRHGKAVIGDPMESSYLAIQLWSRAVRDSGSLELTNVMDILKRMSFTAPEGIVSVDRETLHLWKNVRIGKLEADGQFSVIWSSEHPVRPLPFPNYRTRSDWNELLKTVPGR